MLTTFRLLGAVLLTFLGATLWSETVTWTPERTIDLPVKPSVADEIYPRTVVLAGGGTVQPIDRWWGDKQVDITLERNSFQVRLRDPLFRGNFTVYDDRGNFYNFAVHAHDRDADLDPVLVITPEAITESTRRMPSDTDNAALVLFRHMTGGQRHPTITESPLTRTEGNATVPGEIVHRDTTIEVLRMRLYQSPVQRGYLYTYTWLGEQPVRIDLRQLRPRDAIAMTTPSMVIVPDGTSYLTLQPRRTLPVWYVCRGVER